MFLEPPMIFELPSVDERVYFLVIRPEKTHPDAAAFCADHYGGTLANVSTYADLQHINYLLLQRFPANSIAETFGSLWGYVNGYTASPAYAALNFSAYDVTPHPEQQPASEGSGAGK